MSDEFVLDAPVVRAFVDNVRAALGRAGSAEEACDLIRPRFAELLADGQWLPDAYRAAIHLLTSDTGCVWRHTFDPETGEASPFRSGYVNASCDAEAPW
jgi:hypothetical protein